MDPHDRHGRHLGLARLAGAGIFTLTLAACGGGGGSGGATTPSDSFSASSAQVDPATRELEIDWKFDGSPDDFIVEVNPDGASGYTQADINGDGAVNNNDTLGSSASAAMIDITPHITLFNKALYRVVARDDQGNEIDSSRGIDLTGLATRKFAEYVKASNAEADDLFGAYGVSLSEDGNTMAVAASGEASASTNINGDQTDNSAASAGAVYVFTRNGADWTQQAYLKAHNAEKSDGFGDSIDLSSDGNTLIVGASGEDSLSFGPYGATANNKASEAGAAYLFHRDSSGSWSQQDYIKATNTESGDYFGSAVAISGDGNTIAIGAFAEASNATGINNDDTDNSLTYAGATYVYTRPDASSNWSSGDYIKASNTDGGDRFGSALALSNGGDRLFVGAPGEASTATSVNGNESDNSGVDAGAVYVFQRASGSWSQQAYIKASNADADDRFGTSVATNIDGTLAVVGALGEDSSTAFASADPSNNTLSNAGAAYTFLRSGSSWSQQSYIKSTQPGAEDNFGTSVALSRYGTVVAVGAYHEQGSSAGIDGDPTDDTVSRAGAAYIYTFGGAHTYVKASNPDSKDLFGFHLGLSGDGRTLAVAAPFEDGGTQGVGGDQSDNSAGDAGAVYVY